MFKKKTHFVLTKDTQRFIIYVSKKDTEGGIEVMDKILLRSFMVKFGDTGKSLSSLMGISEQTFSAKLNEKEGAEFNKTEINFFRKRYELSAKMMADIFFK